MKECFTGNITIVWPAFGNLKFYFVIRLGTLRLNCQRHEFMEVKISSLQASFYNQEWTGGAWGGGHREGERSELLLDLFSTPAVFSLL